MKRVGGKVTWLIKLDDRLSVLAAGGIKRTTLSRSRIVEAGDKIRIANADSGFMFATAEVRRTVPAAIRTVRGHGDVVEGYAMTLGGRELSYPEMNAFAWADGFDCVEDLCGYLQRLGKFVGGVFEGQLIEW